MKPSIKTVEKMFSTLNVDTTDVDKCADQIETIFDITEIEAYELAQQLKEKTMKTLKISGFKHVTTTGIARLFKELDSYGTVGMIYELTGEQMANMLMDTRHFNSSTYIEENYNQLVDTSEFDDMMTEIHDELVDAYTMVTWGYSHLQDDLFINGRTITSLSSALEIEVSEWEYKTVDINELEKHCANTTHIEPVYIRLFAHEDGQSIQRFEWTIGEATEFHTFSTMYFAIKALYPSVTIQIV